MNIPQATPPEGYHFRDVQLELSLKPFWDHSAETCEAVCRELFLQWLPLCRFADSVSIQLWIGDGSEILEYRGNPRDSFEWARYHGAANPIAWHAASDAKDSGEPDHDAIGVDARLRDPERRGVHLRSYLYRDEPAVFTYEWLAGLARTLKRVGMELTGKRILVGTTFDIGPEFAVSRFKYEWHPEICGGGSLFGGKFIRCDAVLNPDDRCYAAFPSGIPSGTSIGAFLARQCRAFFADCGFDFLWLSNGFGFGLEPWALTGALFDGCGFQPSSAKQTGERILEFWRHFRAELPDVPVRTRGTNLATGIDLGSDASPLREIYKTVPNLEPPVNSPWAALDGDIGLELAGWMSHIARTPGNGYRFRYYIHDPWWLNSPWLDRYQRQPFDIYLPLSVSRVAADGSVEIPCDIGFLSADDSHGCLPPTVPIEVIAHVQHAREFAPDAPGPVIWVYPFDEYHDLVFQENASPELPFFGDWFVRGMISQSLPINTVGCSDEIERLLEQAPEKIEGSVLLTPVLSGNGSSRLLKYAEQGGRVLFYGPLEASNPLCEVLGIEVKEPLAGDFSPDWNNAAGRLIRHQSVLSAGGWAEASKSIAGGVEQVIARLGDQARVASAFREFPSGGQIGWVRGSLATSEFDPEHSAPIKGPRLKEMNPRRFLGCEDLVRAILAQMGVEAGVEKREFENRSPIMTVHRHRNAFVYSGYQPDPEAAVRLRLRAGAPLFPGIRNRVESGSNVHQGPHSWHYVCRAFVEQPGGGTVECRILPPIQHGYSGRLLVSGLKGGTVRFYPEPGTEERLEVLRNPMFPYFIGEFEKPQIGFMDGLCVTVENVEGDILFSW